MASHKKVAVVGDVTVDWQVILPHGPHGSSLDPLWAWSAPEESQLSAHAGGAALLRASVEAGLGVPPRCGAGGTSRLRGRRGRAPRRRRQEGRNPVRSAPNAT